MENLQNWLRSLMAILLGLWAALPELTHLLVFLMVADTILGLTIAVKQHNLSASSAWDGATKKLGSLLMVGVAALLNPHIQDFIEINLIQVASAFYIVPELTSIIRNAAILDIPVFVQMQPILRYFQAASGETVEAKKTVE
jgi:toxin secretion/phage lysis holin